MTRKLFLAALSAALLAPAAFAQDAGNQPAQANQDAGAAGADKAAVNDQLFAAAAATGGLTEVTISQLGVQKATDPQLKQFSQRMVDEHTKMNQELMALASRKGVAVPKGLDARAAFCAQSLAGLSGEEFDRCYAKAQLIVHMDSVAIFEAEAKRGTDPDMKALAARSLPHIKDHLNTIKPIAQKYMKDDEKGGHDAPKHDQAR